MRLSYCFYLYKTKKLGGERDFESGASTSSAIRACQAAQYMRLTL
jgi:hypothetical protein